MNIFAFKCNIQRKYFQFVVVILTSFVCKFSFCQFKLFSSLGSLVFPCFYSTIKFQIEKKVSCEPLIQTEIDSSVTPNSALFSWWFLRNWFISPQVHKTKTPLLEMILYLSDLSNSSKTAARWSCGHTSNRCSAIQVVFNTFFTLRKSCSTRLSCVCSSKYFMKLLLDVAAI